MLSMRQFDFMTDEDFRTSLESDYTEMRAAFQVGAWKAVHVLAGSIVEALLVDALHASGNQAKDPLKMSLGELIAAAKQQGILTQRASDLSSVVRDYRNLIHPGRLIRLGERADERGAQVAIALADMVIDDVSREKQANYGFTAEQIISKVEHDSSVVAIITHLLKDLKGTELERLLVKVLPKRYFELLEDDPDPSSELVSLRKCFRAGFDLASQDLKVKVARAFVRIIKEETEAHVTSYEDHLFRARDLAFLSVNDARLVVLHLVSHLDATVATFALDEFYDMIDQLGSYIDIDTVLSFTNLMVRYLIRRVSVSDTAAYAIKISAECQRLPQEARRRATDQMDAWVKLYESKGREDLAGQIRELSLLCCDINEIPF